MFSSIVLASAIMLTPQPNAGWHTVAWFDDVLQQHVTQRVLDGTIEADINRVHPYVAPDGSVYDPALTNIRRERNLAAVQAHCQRRLMSEAIPNYAQLCGPGFNKY